MELAREDVDYRTLVGSVIPRPIAWVSTLSEDGVPNLAPFSFFNAVTSTPPVVSIAITRFDDRKPDWFKDTLINIRETEEFVVHIVTMPLLEQMNRSSARLPSDESEFEAADVERVPSTLVDPPRVAEAQVAFECILYDRHPVGGATLILGDIVHAHVDDAVTVDGKLDVNKLDPVARLSAGQYAPLGERVDLERPP